MIISEKQGGKKSSHGVAIYGGVLVFSLYPVLPLLCNSDYWGISQIHGTLIRCGTCGNSDKCDYCVVGAENPMAKEYEIVKDQAGFLVSVPRDSASMI